MKISKLSIIIAFFVMLSISSCFVAEINVRINNDSLSGSSVQTTTTSTKTTTQTKATSINTTSTNKTTNATNTNSSSDEETPPPIVGQSGEFCGFGGIDSCATNSNCKIIGRFGHVCAARDEMNVGLTYKECYDYKKYDMECKCVDNLCEWA